MKEALAFVILALVLIVLAVVISKQHQATYAMPLVQARTIENVARANLLYAPCPLATQNVPIPKENRS